MELNRSITDNWNKEIESIVGVGLTITQRAELSSYFKKQVKKMNYMQSSLQLNHDDLTIGQQVSITQTE